MKCFCCDKDLDNWEYEQDGRPSYHPMGGLHLMSYGHYGSAVFDPLDGSTLNIAICDQCLELREDCITIREATDKVKAELEEARKDSEELLEILLADKSISPSSS